MELSFCKLRAKQVVNICDGSNLGNICDIIFETNSGKIQGIILPVQKNFFNFFKSNNDIFIPYNHIVKIGKDIILVDIIIQNPHNCSTVSVCNNKQGQNCDFDPQNPCQNE